EIQRDPPVVRDGKLLDEPKIGNRLVEFRVRDGRKRLKNASFEIGLGFLGHRAPGAMWLRYRARGRPFFAASPTWIVSGLRLSFFESASFFCAFFCCSMSMPHTFAAFSPRIFFLISIVRSTPYSFFRSSGSSKFRKSSMTHFGCQSA